jgi:iron(III) transport system substrate-binding protein
MKIILLLTTLTLSSVSISKELTIYTSRKEHLLKPLLEKYTKDTGVKFKLKTGKDGALIQSMIAESDNSPADILMTVDAGNLWFAKNSGLFSKVNDGKLIKNIPAHLKDNDNYWFGLSIRARTIVYHPDRVKPNEIISYENLAAPEFKDRLCLRTSKKVYNQSLVSMLIFELGKEKTKKILTGWVRNNVKIFSSDTKLIKAIEAGQCDLGIVNTYYLGRLQKENKNYPVKIYWPNQSSFGVHVNISGAGVTKTSKNKKEAIKFIEWLSSDRAQSTFAKTNLEFPVLKSAKLGPVTSSWGNFKSNTTFQLTRAGELQGEAIKLMQEVGYK